ncbi:hypothetical protein LX36DRAFT_652815 [Colletotrichum falcatum]|nr:hypothetical protein LX36DRAFT_652815 [Colletotrichum falcatum]
MKTSIAQALVLTLAASIKIAEACSSYGTCRCTSADGSVPNNITAQACTAYRSQFGQGDDKATAYLPATDGDGNTVCKNGFIGKDLVFFSNCDFRAACTAAGATGSDSLCSDKQQ